MTHRNLQPVDAHALLRQGFTYLDVRTPEEYADGHPEGAYNVPVMVRGPAGLQPNPEFVPVVKQHFPTDARLLVGCHSGGRSQRACQELAAAGYKDLVNVQNGFGGARDQSGALVGKGWQACGLPCESDSPLERTYAGLRAHG
jgi:rhodanese-related sulfurtransferase